MHEALTRGPNCRMDQRRRCSPPADCKGGVGPAPRLLHKLESWDLGRSLHKFAIAAAAPTLLEFGDL
jgi:hypothetical protein